MTVVLHSDGCGMCDIACQVAGTVDVKDADRGCECLKWETQLFSDQGVDEGGISSAIQQCGDSVVVLSVPNGNSNINEELTVLVDSVGINVFRDLVSDRKGIRFFFVVFVDRMKHSSEPLPRFGLAEDTICSVQNLDIIESL